MKLSKMKFRFLSSNEKLEILRKVNDFYGIRELPFILLETGKKKIRAFSGNLTKEEIIFLAENLNVEIIGMYLINNKDNNPRLSFDAASLLKEQISKNIVDIGDKELELWLRGYDLELKNYNGNLVLRFKDNIVGVGKANEKKIYNYVPKERKLKTPIKNNTL